MDPKQTYLNMFHAMRNDDLTTARALAESLQVWLANGGAYPQHHSETEVDAYLANVLRRTIHLAPTPKFRLGWQVTTPQALETLKYADVQHAIQRHMTGDWGDCDPADAEQNDLALQEGKRILSVYRDRNSNTFWIITEADRSVTTILLPEEY